MLIFDFTLSVLLMILIPVILAGLLRRRFQTPWILFAFGTVTFIGSQVVHIPLNNLLTTLHVLPKTGITDPSITLIQTSLVLGFTAGLCEETARAIGYALLKKTRNLEDGIMLGLGHGGIEAMVFGGVLTAATVSSLIPMFGTDLSSFKLTPDQIKAVQAQIQALSATPLLAAAVPLFERLLAMMIQVILSILVLQAFRRRNWFYYLAAVAYHMLIDSASVYAVSTLTNPYYVYLVLGALLVPGLAWLIFVWRKETHPAPKQSQPVGIELGLFYTAVRKEIIQQWRTQRILIVMAVFVLFGLTSPILARFTPEIIKSAVGSEQLSQIASLFPTPTAADAMAQYIKNITQFGFILAVLLGMNAIAGEKEAGTAALILSKPMPRWAFVLSKFTAQFMVYALAFLVAGIGAYYYTLILFGPLAPAKFIGINLLLLLWLTIFVGAALLGSVIGPSIAAAAGAGLGISVVFLLASSIPKYGMLMPGGIMAWASMLGANSAPVAPNGGAVAAGVVLILLCLIWSVALFERQEI